MEIEFSNCDLDLDDRSLGSYFNLKISYLYIKLGVNRPNQTQVFKWKLICYSKRDTDIKYIHLGSNVRLPLDSYPRTKLGVNRPKQTQVNERKPRFNARPSADFSITITGVR